MAMRAAVATQELRNAPRAPSDDDVVIVCGARTPIGRAKKGAFKSTPPDTLLVAALEGVLARSGVDPSVLGDVVVGNVLQPGAGAVMARMAQFRAALPHTVPLVTLNRQCSSGLEALATVAGHIKLGTYDAAIAAGVESMSTNGMADSLPGVDWEAVNACKLARDCTLPMGITSEMVAKRFGVTRERQDEFAARSHARAAAAQAAGAFDEEIVPVVPRRGEGEAGAGAGAEPPAAVVRDEGVRPGTTPERLARLKPSFQEGGCTTAGNSSQVSDGAAAVLAARSGWARAAGLQPMGRLLAYAVVGVPPDIMGVGPAYAIPEALRKAGLTIDDVDVFEVNEAFASQCLYCADYLSLPPEKVNPLGGAIALGHPLGCTGVRQVVTLLHHMRREGKRIGVVSMCVGTGMGAAAVFEAM
mmetsp:Transcript_17765/g.60351  ORF Transcript_17765/g.60351 Transcript_17765/m.60351 type:complete len:415 (-) Transcript_17765:34-1278(-)